MTKSKHNNHSSIIIRTITSLAISEQAHTSTHSSEQMHAHTHTLIQLCLSKYLASILIQI